MADYQGTASSVAVSVPKSEESTARPLHRFIRYPTARRTWKAVCRRLVSTVIIILLKIHFLTIRLLVKSIRSRPSWVIPNEWGRRESLGVGAKDLIGESDNLHYIDATLDKSKTTGSNSATEYGLISYLGPVHYDYADKYLITATFRRDGSSKFSGKNRWGNFPSFALGWRMDSEEFFKKMKADWISSLKLRAGWGQYW